MSVADIICKVGLSVEFYDEMRPWLDEVDARRLFFIEENPDKLSELGIDAILLRNDKRVRIFYLETPLLKDSIAQKIGSLSAFRTLSVVGDPLWKEKIERAHLEAELLASDAADFGVKILAHQAANLKWPLRSLLDLKGAQKNRPAIVAGAGPSLEQTVIGNGFLIAAGNAINCLKVKPHLALAICPHNPVIRHQYLDVPLCIQSRSHPGSAESATGEKFWLPDPHFGPGSFPGGWTVGNTALAVAVHLGCNPIVLVGMDSCYREGKKYAGSEEKGGGVIETVDRDGNRVYTQADWIQSIRWMEAFAKLHPEIDFYNATPSGLKIGEPFLERSLDSFEWSNATPLPLSPIQKIPALTPRDFFDPLWRIWQPLFERELMTDLQPLSLDEKLAIQKDLFFAQVLEEHSYAR